MERAACRDEDPELFFSPDNERGAVRHRRAQAAKAVCRRCDVALDCLEFALSREIPSGRAGVYGGLTSEERARRSRPRITLEGSAS